jgi:hypothetical protein
MVASRDFVTARRHTSEDGQSSKGLDGAGGQEARRMGIRFGEPGDTHVEG